jgi:hypothetical protein
MNQQGSRPAAESAQAVAGAERKESAHPESPAAEAPLLTEIVRLYLYDVGRSIDLKMIRTLIPAHPDLGLVKRRDTPPSLSLPKPLVISLGKEECEETGQFECFNARAKIYDDGALTLVIRVKVRVGFSELHLVRNRTIISNGETMTLNRYADESFRKLYEAIKPAINGSPVGGEWDRETYTAYCLLECPERDPALFISKYRDFAASLLAGEEPGILHESQIRQTLEKPISYRKDDIAIFDMDRCLIVDPAADYEDLLLIAEHANYRLLELRVLDARLDSWLEDAERDLSRIYIQSAKAKKFRDNAQVKFARIQSLRFDALFILENLDNSSKIIGDYYLGQVYTQLCTIFNTEAWKLSVERRLDALQEVYDMVKTDTGERRMVTLEIVFIVVCIILPLIQILQVMISG